MLRRFRKNNNQAQIFLEYTVICGIVVMILISMNMMMKRGIQGMIKSVADQVGSQINAEQGFSDAGHLESQYVSTRTSVSKTTRELLGVTNYIYDSISMTNTEALANLGFVEEE